MIVALQTARAGSKSVPSKNIAMVGDKSLFLYNILSAQKSRLIEDVYVSTDCPYIKRLSKEWNYNIIDRPQHLCGDNASHHDTIRHGLTEIEHRAERVELLVVLLGNSVAAYSCDLDASIEIMLNNKDIDSVTSVSEFDMFNPSRAYSIVNGRLDTIMSQDMIASKTIGNPNDKNAMGKIYFFNGSFWVCKRCSVLRDDGMLPFPWMGQRSIPYVQKTTMEVDAEWQLSYLKREMM
ncbi:hypothetical protein LCGC14_1412390 [marine sediment metagenome]|uniref:Cytidylyltransferase n=1 Tax=marine sediment metagenome TaxID=412755 RepID=A0A0F9KEW0_9ZZZZ